METKPLPRNLPLNGFNYAPKLVTEKLTFLTLKYMEILRRKISCELGMAILFIWG